MAMAAMVLMVVVQMVLLSGLDGVSSLKAYVDDPDAVAEMVQM